MQTAEKIEADAPANIDLTSVFSDLRDGVPLCEIRDYDPSGRGKPWDRGQCEQRLKHIHKVLNAGRSNLRAASVAEADAIREKWKQNGIASDSEFRMAYDAGRLKGALAKMDAAAVAAAGEARERERERARETIETYQSEKSALADTISAAASGEAFLKQIAEAVTAHVKAERARDRLQRLHSDSCIAATLLGQQPPQKSEVQSAPPNAVKIYRVFSAAYKGNWMQDSP